METISFHSNQSSYPIGTKTQLFVPPAYNCYMWNLVRIGFMASEEMSFENVDWRRTDRRRMPAYTISSPISLRLRWAKILKENRTYIKNIDIDIYTTCSLNMLLSYLMRKHEFLPYANNKGADQPIHPRSLISASVIHYLDIIIPILAKSKISRL